MDGVTKRDNCRLCHSKNLTLVMPLAPTPLEDQFLKFDDLIDQPFYPLDVYFCEDCYHLQNLHIVNPDLIYKKYTYRTSVNPGLVQHFKDYAEKIDGFIPPESFVIDIGSNDGTLLKQFKQKGHRVFGVDPAQDIADEANEAGILTRCDFLTVKVAKDIVDKLGQANLVCANNVFAHADDLDEIVESIKILLKDDGLFVFECSYLLDMIHPNKMLIDVINHDHLSHHSVISLVNFLNGHGLILVDVEKINTKGGSIRCFVRKNKEFFTGTLKIFPFLLNEDILKDRNIYSNFYISILAIKNRLKEYLDKEVLAGKTILGYGASCTTTALMCQFCLEDRLYYLVDDNILKKDTRSPANYSLMVRDKIDFSSTGKKTYPKRLVIVILAHLYADEIIKKNQDFLEAGGKFVIPLPKIKIVSRETTTYIETEINYFEHFL